MIKDPIAGSGGAAFANANRATREEMDLFPRKSPSLRLQVRKRGAREAGIAREGVLSGGTVGAADLPPEITTFPRSFPAASTFFEGDR